MRRWLAAVVAVAGLAVVGCTSELASELPRSKEFTLYLEGERGAIQRTPVDGLGDLEDAVPFKPVLPTWLPEGLYFRSASVKAARDRVPVTFNAGFAPERPSTAEGDRISLGLWQYDAAEYTRLVGPLEEVQAGDKQVSVVDLGGVEGRIWRLTNGPPTATAFMLQWEACEIWFWLAYQSLDGTPISEDELAQVARSMVEACS